MVERGSRPLRRRMAGFTRLRESRSRVIRLPGPLEVAQVAVRADARRSGELPSRMARRAGQVGMFTCQRETRCAVVELGALPLHTAVAGFTQKGEVGSPVIRICGALVVRSVATATALGSPRKSPSDVARNARGRGMRTS